MLNSELREQKWKQIGKRISEAYAAKNAKLLEEAEREQREFLDEAMPGVSESREPISRVSLRESESASAAQANDKERQRKALELHVKLKAAIGRNDYKEMARLTRLIFALAIGDDGDGADIDDATRKSRQATKTSFRPESRSGSMDALLESRTPSARHERRAALVNIFRGQ